MTENRNFKTLKSRILVLLTVICLVMTTCFLFTACGGSSSEQKDTTTYTYTETNTEPVSNADFVYGTYNIALNKFPVTSVNGWSRTVDNSASSSSVNSGVINVEEKAFTELLSSLYSDSDFVNYFKNKDNFTTESVKAAIKTEKGEDYSPTDTDVKDYILEHYITPAFVNPGVREGAEDNFVYMLNNYAKNEHYGFGTAQRITSSSSISVKKGETYKVSVWVKTLLLSKGGANVRLTNSVNGQTQAQFKISNITDTEWTNYTVYFKADENYAASFTLVLGLGYGNGSSTEGVDFAEGTVFFDGITVEKVEDFSAEISGKTINDSEKFVLGADDSPEYILTGEQTDRTVYYLYYVNVTEGAATYFTDIELPSSIKFTESNVKEDGEYITSKTLVGDESTVSAQLAGKELTLNVNKAGGTIKIENAEKFKVQANGYVLVNFLISNRLNVLGSTAVTVDLYDVAASVTEKRAAIATFSTVSEEEGFELATVLVKNNFSDGERSFYLEIIVGPTDVKSVKSAQAFATGTVVIKDLKVAAGSLEHDEENIEHELYHFFSEGASATQSLYAGYTADYQEQTDTTTYNLSPASGNVGTIINNPSPVKDYFGIVSNHTYIKEETEDVVLETAVNTRTDFDGDYGYAGLINTRYLANYPAELAEKLGDAYSADNNIQPIVIYNKTADHYGFIGSSKTIAASAYAKVTVQVRVVGDAKAYVYLVDTGKANKEVIDFADFTLNGETVKAEDHKLCIVISRAEMAKAQDGFVTVNFYVATGADAKNFRVEIWNGGRDGDAATASAGYVFVNSINVSTASAFSEPTNTASAFSKSGNPLYDLGRDAFTSLISYTRELTEDEINFNAEYPDQAVSYSAKYIWGETGTDIYAIYNTVNPVVSNPYDNIPEEETEGGGCTANTDSASFWMSLSTILLAVAIVVALIALIAKNVRRKRIANRSDAKSHYKVTSRTEAQKAIKTEKAKRQTEQVDEPVAEEPETEEAEETQETETAEEEEPKAEEAPQDLDSYVYGEVQDFGEELTTNEDKPEEDEKPE